MRRAPWWALVSAGCAPLLLIGGWTVAATRQPAGYDSTVETISSLAALGATDRWLMTAALVGEGICYILVAIGLTAAALPGRVLLGIGGVATVLVALFPLPRDGSSAAHTAFAGLAFVLVAAWPLVGWRRGPGVPWAVRPPVAVAAAAVLLGLVGWFVLALDADSNVGLAERVAAGAQSVWPLFVAVSTRQSRYGRSRQTAST